MKHELTPAKIIYNGVATVVFWNDGTKTVVRRSEGTKDDKYNAFCAALAKKVFGTNSKLKNCIKEAENAKRVKRVEINTEPLKVGDRVRVLDGSNIPDYLCGWAVDMGSYVGSIQTVKRVYGRGVDLENIHPNYTWDARGLKKV